MAIRRSIILTCSLLLATCSLSLQARHIDRATATRAAQNWVQRGRHLGGAHFGTGKVRGAHHFEVGTNGFYAVSFEKGGTVFTAGDDDEAPILAFTSATNDFSTLDRASPLWALLSKRVARDSSRARRVAPDRRNHARWSSLTNTVRTAAYATAATASSSSSVDDLRVAPLLQSKWDQTAAGGKYCYNYYTPNHDYCGCVATAMSQVMRYHQYPASCKSTTHTCYLENVATNCSTLAGSYDYANMPLSPTYGITDAQREAIGHLCYDAGVSVYMGWTSSGSGAFMCNVAKGMKDTFGYASGFYYSTGVDSTGSVYNTLPDEDNAVNCTTLVNLDAGCPVLYGIVDTAKSAGHCIVADGYGFSDDYLYVHLNIGWSGSYDVWYNLPEGIAAGSYNFDTITDVAYNISPKDASNAILSGRVTDQNGNAVSNQTIQIIRTKTPYTKSGSSWWSTYTKGSSVTSAYTNVTTSATGVYAAFLPGSTLLETNTYQIIAHGVTNTVTLLANVPESISWSCGITSSLEVKYTADTISPENGYGTLGNSWGNDLVIDTSIPEPEPEPEPEPVITYAYYQKVPYMGKITYWSVNQLKYFTTNAIPWATAVSGQGYFHDATNTHSVASAADITTSLALTEIYYESSSTAGKYWSTNLTYNLTLSGIDTNGTDVTGYYCLSNNYVCLDLLKVEDGTGRASDLAIDYDGDGFSSAEEQAWGIDPANPTNFPFAFTSFSLTNLTFIGSIQGTLELQRSTNLVDWTTARTISTHPNITNTVDLSAYSASNGFYRVKHTL